MNLWLICLFLLVGTSPNASGLTPEECQPLITPLSLADPSSIHGKVNFLAGYTDYSVFRAILGATESSWLKINESLSNNVTEVIMTQENRINGSCVGSSVAMNIEGNTVKMTMKDLDVTFFVLPSCESCLLMSINYTTSNAKKLLRQINVKNELQEDDVQGRSLYLFDKGLTLSDSDLERFKKQAACLGYVGEPDFLFKPGKSFCQEGEGIKITYS